MKVRKQGNSLVITIPKNFDVKPGTDLVAMKGRHGELVYAPKMANPFTNPNVHMKHHHEMTGSDNLEGREQI